MTWVDYLQQQPDTLHTPDTMCEMWGKAVVGLERQACLHHTFIIDAVSNYSQARVSDSASTAPGDAYLAPVAAAGEAVVLLQQLPPLLQRHASSQTQVGCGQLLTGRHSQGGAQQQAVPQQHWRHAVWSTGVIEQRKLRPNTCMWVQHTRA